MFQVLLVVAVHIGSFSCIMLVERMRYGVVRSKTCGLACKISKSKFIGVGEN